MCGNGYNYDRPVFYYSTMMMIENGVDVVHVHYQDSLIVEDGSIERTANKVQEAFKKVVEEVHTRKIYDGMMVLAKSLGTLAIDLRQLTEELVENICLLTPLLMHNVAIDLIQGGCSSLSLIIGTEDHHYNKEKLNLLEEIGLKVIKREGLNHSLDYIDNDTTRSLESLTVLLKDIELCLGLDHHRQKS